MAKYTDQDTVVNYIKRELTTAEVNLLPMLINNVSLFIENYTSRSWKDVDATAETEKTERYFDGSNDKEIYVDNFRSLESVSIVDASGSVISEYKGANLIDLITYPLNGEAKTSLYLVAGRFSGGSRRVKIKAIFDSGDVPSDVQYVATAMVAKLLTKMGDDMRGNVKGKKLADFSVTYGEVKGLGDQMQIEVSLLDQYKRIEL